LTKQKELLDTCAHILSIFIARPDIYQTASAKKIREQIQFIQANPTKFPPVSGDYLPNDIEPIAVGDYSSSRTAISIPKLTPAYVSRLAKGESVLDESTPIFQVAAPPDKNFEVTKKEGYTSRINFTHLRILDGSGGVMLGRLNMNLAHDGAKLSGGDIIQLHMFTPLTYPPSKGHDNKRSPMVVIHRCIFLFQLKKEVAKTLHNMALVW
jgi:hypothetical protein